MNRVKLGASITNTKEREQSRSNIATTDEAKIATRRDLNAANNSLIL